MTNETGTSVSPAPGQPAPGRFAAWDRFWFTPADPTLLGLIRICCGLITLYSLVIYSFTLQEFLGADGWVDLEGRLEEVNYAPTYPGNLNYPRNPVMKPTTPQEEEYVRYYKNTWNTSPPPPMPRSQQEAHAIDAFILHYKVDPRVNGLKRLPDVNMELFQRFLQGELKEGNLEQFLDNRTVKELLFLQDYMRKLGQPPPDYPNFDDPQETALLWGYIDRYGRDPRLNYATGTRLWSLWFDLTDPTGMAIVHGIVILIVLLFTIGFCTRVTSALTWMCTLWYIHRNTAVLFGVDTMQTILLLYLMIGPSGAALSVDRLIARWWSGNKLRVVNRWRSWWGKPALTAEQIVPAVWSPRPEPSVSANVAYRLIQIHLCIIYLIAGLAKLMGPAWWTGTAVWKVVANYEFAPMQYSAYMWVLRQSVAVQWVWHLLLTAATYFTLVFEIGYVFAVWRPATRWWALGGAVMLHGFIGLFMGLKTFSLMMLVMNMAFLKNREVNWFLSFFQRKKEAPRADLGPALAPKPLSTAIREGTAKGR